MDACGDGLHGRNAGEAQTHVGGYRAIQSDIAPDAAEHLEALQEADVSSAAHGHALRPAAFGGGSVDITRTGGTACDMIPPPGAITWEPRVREIFCATYPVTLNWPAGCTAP